MTKRTKIALVAGCAALAMAGVGGGIAFAADSGSAPGTPTPTPAASSTPAPAHHARAHRLLSGLEHGQFTVRTKSGDQVLDVQRGQVVAVSATSVTVRSQDGFTATYTVGSTAKVRVQEKASTITSVHAGDKVSVAATHSGTTDTLRRLVDAN